MKSTALAAVTLLATQSEAATSTKYSGQHSPSFLAKLDSSEEVQGMNLKKEPRVELSGYLYDWTNDMTWQTLDSGQVFGVSFFAHSDLFASVHSPAYWISRQGTGWMIFNPHLFGEGSAAFGITLKLWLWHVTLNFKLMGVKFAPLDFQFALDLSDTSRYCYSVGYFQEVFDFLVEVETDAYECYTGLIGWATENDKEDCMWRKYRPQLPLYQVSLLDSADKVSDYLPWQCSDDSELTTDERIDPDTGEVVIHPHGWEPTNIDKGGDYTEEDAGKLDEGQQGIEDGWDVEGTTIWEGGADPEATDAGDTPIE